MIVHNTSHSPARIGSDVMHELAHLLLDHEPGTMFFGLNNVALRSHDKGQEEEATWLGGCFLLPREAPVTNLANSTR